MIRCFYHKAETILVFFLFTSYPKTDLCLNFQFVCFQLIYEVKKKGMITPFKGEKDVCETVEKFGKKPDVAQKMQQYKISKKCPMEKVSSVCLPQVHVSVRIIRIGYCLMECRSRLRGESQYQLL